MKTATAFLVLGLLAALPVNVMAAPDGPPRGEQIVTGSRLGLPPRETGKAFTVLDRTALGRSGLAYAADALRHVPGLAVSRAGGFGGLTQLRIRGADGNHVLVLIDGVEVAPAASGEFDLSSLLTAGIERIEVVRGPESGIYGSNAVAGVVQIITRGNGPSGFGGSLEGGSYGTYQGAAHGRISGGRGFLALNGAYRRTDGFSVSPAGHEKDGDENLTLGGRGRLILSGRLRLDANLRYTDKNTQTDDQDFSGGPLQGTVIDSAGESDTRDLSGGVTGTLSLLDGDWVSTAGLSYADNEVLGYSFGAYGSASTRRKLTASSSYHMDLGRTAHTFLAFIEHERETYRNTMPQAPSQEAKQDRGMLGFGAEYHVGLMERLHLTGALRHDDNEDFRDATTYRLSAAYLAGAGSRLHASLGTGVTNPTFFEQFGFLPSSFTGNPDLAPEKSKGWDLGLEQTVANERLTLDATWFHSVLQDEITPLFPSVINATGRSRREGVELSLNARPVRGLEIAGSYTYVRAHDPDGSREIRRPKHMGSLDVTYLFPGEAFTLYLGAVYNGRMLDDDYRGGFTPVKTALQAYWLVNAALTYRVSPHVELFGRIDNLADETYQELLGYAAPGISGFAGVRLRYNAGP